MAKEHNRYMVLGERCWWGGLALLIFIVFMFARDLLIKEDGFVFDPLYIFSVLMVGLLIASPILWIFNDGKRLLADRNTRSSGESSDIFRSLLSLSDRFRIFKDISIKNEKFDAVVIGSKVIFVIGIHTDKDKKNIGSLDGLIARTKNKEKVLNDLFKNRFVVRTVLASESDEVDESSESQKERARTLSGPVKPSDLESVLVEFDSEEEGERLPVSVIEELERVWKREVGTD